MRYCHECGAEVAPGDAFCSFCGIALNSVSVIAREEAATPKAENAAEIAKSAEAQISEIAAESKKPLQLDAEHSFSSSPTAADKPAELDSETVFGFPAPTHGEKTFAGEEEPPKPPEAFSDELKSASMSAEPENEENEFDATVVGATIHKSTIVKPAETPSQKIAQPAPIAKFDEVPENANEDLQTTIVEQSANLNEQTPANEKAQLVNVSEDKTLLSVELPQTPAIVESPRATDANRAQETPGSKSPKLKPLDEGTILNNRYKIVRRIGGGGMGAVYLAEDANLSGVQRAVKEMIQAYVDEEQQEKAVADFRRESVLLTQLEHPSIPTIYDYFFDEPEGRFYLVMKYIAGGDLAGRLRAAPEGRLDEGSVTDWAIQIADVLDYLHRREPPIVYRDLKPSNIMLDANGKAMLIDFGIARWVNKEEKGVTAVGTMGYAPPELFAGNAEPRSDIYSLGATMFHLLTGADPQSNPLLIFDFTKNPKPRNINPLISVEMEDILLRSVEYNAGLRFESAARMRDVLREHLQKLQAGQLTFHRTEKNIAQVMPIPAQPPPPLPFDKQPQVNMVFCGHCGEKIIATDLFCAYCGAPQTSAAATRQNSGQMMQTMLGGAAAEQISGKPRTDTARLVVLGTQELEEPTFNLEKESNLVGREDRRANIFPEIDLTRYDRKAQVSRRHARIFRDGADYLVEDLKSSNGTVLISDNQAVRLVANQPHILRHGDKLKLGETTLRFYLK
jgi:serine/threonine protein kinase